MSSSTKTSNVVVITNETQFAQEMKDAQDLAVLFFWAAWHAPCAQFDKLVDEVAKDHPAVKFLKIEAEAVPDVTGKYEQVTSVPTFLFIRNGQVAEVLERSTPQQFVSTVVKHVKAGAVTSAVQATAPTSSAAPTGTLTPELRSRLSKLLAAQPVMVFMKGVPTAPRCGFSRQLVELLNSLNVTFGYFDILTDETVRQGLKQYANFQTYPQLWIKGELIGGIDIAKELNEEKELVSKFPPEALKGATTSLNDRLKALINQKRVMLFMKGTADAPQCGFSRAAVDLLRQCNFEFGTFNILQDDEVRQGLKEYSNWKTYPQLYVDGKLIGGIDIMKEMHEENELASLAKPQSSVA